ncbi:MAG TPA: nucleotidyl transferase AbiEii/AbiGii toxin family protein [Candidatus Paceibacterota bacterium]
MLPAKTVKAFEFFSKEKWLGDSNWYLAGGTALTLQVGHRKSVDLDFFTQDKDFNNDDLLEHFQDGKNWQADVNRKNTIYGELFGAKVSFIAYPFFIPAESPISYGSIRILKKEDIAVMKIIAISQRGRKRDFFDLYWFIQNGEILEEIMRKLKKQYPSVAHDYHHILKSLVYFEDAEIDPNPEINFKASWNDVKNYFKDQIPMITRKLVDLK